MCKFVYACLMSNHHRRFEGRGVWTDRPQPRGVATFQVADLSHLSAKAPLNARVAADPPVNTKNLRRYSQLHHLSLHSALARDAKLTARGTGHKRLQNACYSAHMFAKTQTF